jgi:hypothetical protein
MVVSAFGLVNRALDRVDGFIFNSAGTRVNSEPQETLSMPRKQIAVALVFLFVAFASSFVLADKAKHKGEILAIDKDAKTVTVRVASEETGQKETHVYEVQETTAIKDKTTGKALTFTDLKVGDKVNLTGQTQGKKRVALAIEIRPDKEGKK